MKCRKIVVAALAASMLTASLAGCGSRSDSITYNEDGKPVISIMTTAFSSKSASDDAAQNSVVAQIEDKLGVDLRFRWTISGSYNEKVTAVMASDTYPQIMKMQERNSAFIANCRGGSFWEVGDKIKDAEKYPNLSKARDEIMNNISVDGKVYAVYSSRDLGRYLTMIREDWLENVGMEYPTTLEEFGEMCKRFTENDPDGNGQNDTFGMILTSFMNPVESICVWAGAPNGYGINEETGDLEPAYYFDEYMTGLKFLRNMFEKGYINKNWATMDPERWNEMFLNGQGGVIIDVGSRAKKLEKNIKDINPNARVGLFGSVAPDENSERRVLPTDGYSGFFVFPKSSVKTEEELELCLTVLDKFGDADISDLMQYGIEGVQYDIKNGKYVKKKTESGGDVPEVSQYSDLNQLLPFITHNTNLNIPYDTKVAELNDVIVKDNANYCIFNPAEPFVSKTYALTGTMLDSIMEEANTKFINGVIDEAGWYAVLEEWKAKGGAKVVDELNEQYREVQNKNR